MENNNAVKFWDRVERVCEETGKSMSSIGVALGFSRAWACAYKKKGTVPTEDKLNQMAAYLGTTPGYLCGDHENTEEPEVVNNDEELKDEPEETMEENEAEISMVVHSGTISMIGTPEEMYDFCKKTLQIDSRYKITINFEVI